jgi:hypothetical protein
MEKTKEIIGKFLNIEASQISDDTLINRKALQSSVMVHRMYAELSAAGYKVRNYHTINTYSDLLKRLRSENEVPSTKVQTPVPEAEMPKKKKWFGFGG